MPADTFVAHPRPHLHPQGKPREVPFVEVCHSALQWEVARDFAAMLQLVNSGNVSLRLRDGGTGAAAVGGTASTAGGRRGRKAAAEVAEEDVGGRVVSADELLLVLHSTRRDHEK